MSLALTIRPELEELIRNISQRNTYYGNKISDSIMRQFLIEETKTSSGILVPFWLPVVERGRGPRRNTKDHGLVKKIYAWMQRRNLFRAVTEKGKWAEARSITWYINKYGNKQFRSKVFIDVYRTERQKTIEKINQKYGIFIGRITTEIL